MEFLNISYISKVNLASLNGSEGLGGNITPVKKISGYDGKEYVYISGQALRRYIKETLRELGYRISSVDNDGNPYFDEFQDKIFSKKGFADKKLMFNEFIDMDLFGYMFPNIGRRWSPVKVAPMISVLPYKGEYDYLTRKQKVEDETKKSGNIVQIEIDTLNFMRGNIIADCDKIGKHIDEYNYSETMMLDNKEIEKRINSLLDAVKHLNGGAKQSRNLEDISPKFVIAANQKIGNPFLLNSISVNGKGNIIFDGCLEELECNKDVINKVTIGISKNIFANYDEVITAFKNKGYTVTNVYAALDSLKKGEN